MHILLLIVARGIQSEFHLVGRSLADWNEVYVTCLWALDCEVIDFSLVCLLSPSCSVFPMMIIATSCFKHDTILLLIHPSSLTLHAPKLSIGILYDQIITQVLPQVRNKHVVTNLKKSAYNGSFGLLSNPFRMPFWSE